MITIMSSCTLGEYCETRQNVVAIVATYGHCANVVTTTDFGGMSSLRGFVDSGDHWHWSADGMADTTSGDRVLAILAYAGS